MQSRKEEMLLHFVGIGGIGMSGIAEVFINQGYHVSGSDVAESEILGRLRHLGAKIYIGHEAKNVRGATVVVISSAIRPINPEVVEAKHLRIPVIPRAEMLGELMRGKTGIAVAGTHGKTTTTSMLATVLTMAGLDPTLVIGGKVEWLGGTAKLGQGELVVAEADESDGSFVHLPATFGIITNIDNDHLDYFGSITEIENTFVEFVGEFPFYGLVAVCAEDEGVRRCLERFTKPIITYGFSDECDFFATNVEITRLGSSFQVKTGGANSDKGGATFAGAGAGAALGQVELNVPGKHNVLNALAVIVISIRLGISFDKIIKGLAQFHGVKRRFEIRWQKPEAKRVLVDDYGHHPTEISATLEAARTYWPGRIITVFQPHRYSRTLHCHDGFMHAFKHTNVLLVTDIYPAAEDPIEGVTSENLVREIKRAAGPGQEIIYVGGLNLAEEAVTSRLRDGDMVLCLGAGSITKLADRLVLALKTAT